MIITFKQGIEIPFVFGLAVTQAIPKKDILISYLDWKKKAEDQGLDTTSITLEMWKAENCQTTKDGKSIVYDADGFQIYYQCYVQGCLKHKKEPVSYNEFIELIDANYAENIQLISEAIKELSGSDKVDDDTEKNG